MKYTNLFFSLSAGLMLGAIASGCSLVNPIGRSNFGNSASTTLSQGAESTRSTSVPTLDAIAGRIQKGIPSANPSSGNFKTVLAQVQENLPAVADPTKASGLADVPLLVYAACTDINPSTYNVNTNASVSSNMANLVKAGVSMVNSHVANLAASGTLNTQVSQVFTNLVNADMNSGASTAMTFVSVCLAANSFGVGMTGF